MAKNPTTDQLLIAYRQGEQKGREGEQLKIANNRFRNWNPHGSINEDGDAYRDYKRPPEVPGELPDKYRGPVFGTEEGGQMFFDFVKQLQINPDQIAGALLPGERGSSNTGGLKGMRPSDVDRYLKENNITGPAADKIWKKYKGLQGGTDLFPLANVQGLPQEQLMANLSSEALNALKAGTQKGLSSKQIRDLLKPYTKPDQFGHPTGSFRGV